MKLLSLDSSLEIKCQLHPHKLATSKSKQSFCESQFFVDASCIQVVLVVHILQMTFLQYCALKTPCMTVKVFDVYFSVDYFVLRKR